MEEGNHSLDKTTRLIADYGFLAYKFYSIKRHKVYTLNKDNNHYMIREIKMLSIRINEFKNYTEEADIARKYKLPNSQRWALVLMKKNKYTKSQIEFAAKLQAGARWEEYYNHEKKWKFCLVSFERYLDEGSDSLEPWYGDSAEEYCQWMVSLLKQKE